MDIVSHNGMERPHRLSEGTRRFADESLRRKYGKDTKNNPGIPLDGYPGIENMSDIDKYDVAVTEIAKHCPIRICEGELISGAATLGLAIEHNVPATLASKPVFLSISHLTIDFETVLKCGISGIRRKVEASLALHQEGRERRFLESCITCLDAFGIFHKRYLDALSVMPEYRDNYNCLLRVPFEPARSFREAVQSLWFTFAFVRLMGNWPGIGRIDLMLRDYLDKDIKADIITVDEAREILAHLFIKGCEWICGDNEFSKGSGDSQHYQNIVLAGTDKDGGDATCLVTYLVLDIIEELGIGDFPTTVRLRRDSSPELLRRVAEVIRYGGGAIALYNEELILEALAMDGYEREEAVSFANDGCWEVQIPGKTYFGYIPFDSLQILQRRTLEEYSVNTVFSDFEELYRKFISDLRDKVEEICLDAAKRCLGKDTLTGHWKWREQIPCTVVSLFEEGCIDKGTSYLEGGPVYNVLAPHIGGLADTVNTLYAIKKLCFDEKRLPFEELMSVLRQNWQGNEALRRYVMKKYRYYGNDNDEVDGIYRRVLSDFADICKSFDGMSGYHHPSGVSTFGRQLEWAPYRLATPSGRLAGEILAANASPTPGTDSEGATAIIRSYCKADLRRLATGAALDIRLLPDSVRGEDGILALIALMRGFVELGGFFMQPDVQDVSLLRAAQADPDSYETLSVRVSGWNARFVTLDRDWQEMVIKQNEGR